MPLLEHERVAQSGYDRQATVYDENRYVSFQGKYHLGLFRNQLLRAIGAAEPGRILDVAIGTGVGAASYFGGPATIFGADLSREMMGVARARAAAAHHELHLAQCNGRALPFASDSFRGLFSLRFFHHVPHGHRKPILAEMRRVLGNGAVAVLDFKNPFYGLVLNQIRDHILRDRQGHYLYPWQVRDLFEGFEIVDLCGVYMPFGQYVARISPRLAAAYQRLARLWPCKFFCMNLFVVVRKSPAGRH